MRHNMYFSLLWVALGAALITCHLAGLMEAYWYSMGISLLVVGILQLLRFRRYQKNAAYREKVDTENSDERNKFISGRAWAWAGYAFVMIAAVAAIASKIAGREDLMMFCSGSVCLIVLLYWGSYMILKRKY